MQQEFIVVQSKQTTNNMPCNKNWQNCSCNEKRMHTNSSIKYHFCLSLIMTQSFWIISNWHFNFNKIILKDESFNIRLNHFLALEFFQTLFKNTISRVLRSVFRDKILLGAGDTAFFYTKGSSLGSRPGETALKKLKGPGKTVWNLIQCPKFFCSHAYVDLPWTMICMPKWSVDDPLSNKPIKNLIPGA